MKQYFKEAMNHIAGTCLLSPEQALNDIMEFHGEIIEPTEVEVEEFEKFLNDNECYECEECGWYSYPGETCACDDEDEDS